MFDLDHWQEIAVALRRNKVRTALTAFGVFWGLFLLIIMLGSGQGLENGVTREYSGLATNSFFIWAQRTSKPWAGLPPGRQPQLRLEDASAVKSAVAEVEIVAPRCQIGGYGTGTAVTRGVKSGAFNVTGDTPDFHHIVPVTVKQGRLLNPLDLAERRKVAVVGRRVVELLFEEGEDPIGEAIAIRGVYFQVVGVFQPLTSGEDAEQDSQNIHVPLSTFQRSFNYGERIDWLSVTAAPGVPASTAQDRVLGVLHARHRVAPDDRRAFGRWNTEEEYLKIQGLFTGIRLLVWIVGTGTLAAGVIGVSNIMLVIVRERTKELGIRRAVGATPLWIVGQVVLEALVLTAAAGYLGVAAGMAVLEAVRALLPPASGEGFELINPDVSPATVLQALAILIAAGVLAGLLPAERAVRMRTAEALRAE